MRIGVVALSRPTFDVELASSCAARAREVVASLGHDVVGDVDASDDPEGTVAAARLAELAPDAVVILQTTFTTAAPAEAVHFAFDGPIVLWGFPEPPGAERLRLNSLCGVTLASYALRHRGADVRWVYGSPDDGRLAGELASALGAAPPPVELVRAPRAGIAEDARERAALVAEVVRGATIGRLGTEPDGFDPCAYDADALGHHLGLHVEQRSVDDLFVEARSVNHHAVEATRRAIDKAATGIDELDRTGVERSIRLHLGLRSLARRCGWQGVAARCWPECMTEYGSAICTPLALLADRGVSTGCEADVLGTISNLVLHQLTGRPGFLADLVSIDHADDSATLWHCGVAAPSLARTDEPVTVRRHPNRHVPLAHDFELAPGRVTLVRLTQRPDRRLALVVGGGDVLDRHHHLRGTTAVVRFDRPVHDVLTRVVDGGLDHHLSLGYGDVRDELEALASIWDVDVIDL